MIVTVDPHGMYHVQVQVKQRKWPSDYARACGVIVREGNIVLGLDRCHSEAADAGLRVYNYTSWSTQPVPRVYSDPSFTTFTVCMEQNNILIYIYTATCIMPILC